MRTSAAQARTGAGAQSPQRLCGQYTGLGQGGSSAGAEVRCSQGSRVSAYSDARPPLRAASRPPAKPKIKPMDALSIQSPAFSKRSCAGVISAAVTGVSHIRIARPTDATANRLTNIHRGGIWLFPLLALSLTAFSPDATAYLGGGLCVPD